LLFCLSETHKPPPGVAPRAAGSATPTPTAPRAALLAPYANAIAELGARDLVTTGHRRHRRASDQATAVVVAFGDQAP